MLCFSVVSWLRRFAKVGPKSEVVRRIGCPRCRQNLHHACARERFGSQNRKKLACSKRFWKLSFVKFAPRLRARAIWKAKSLKTGGVGALLEVSFAKFAARLRARAIWKSKSLKTDGLGTFFEVQSVFCVAGAGISTRCKIRGRRRSS